MESLLTGLIAVWELDETTGATAQEELDDFDATYYGPTLGATSVSSGFGTAVDFDTNTDYIQIPSTIKNSFTSTAMSVSLWVKVDTYDANKYLVQVNNGGTNTYGWILYLYRAADDNILFRIYTSGAVYYDVVTAGSLTSTEWQHVVAVSEGEGGYVKIYLNGTLSATGNVQIDAATINFTGDLTSSIGNNSATGYGTAAPDAKIDRVMMWSRALTTEEVEYLYDSGTYPFE